MENEYLVQSGVLLLLGLILAWWARHKELFTSMHNPDFDRDVLHPTYRKLRWYHVVTGFAALIFVQIFLLGLLVMVFPKMGSTPISLGYLVVIVNLLFALFLAFYIKKEHLKSILFHKKKYLKAGLLTLLVALPWVFLSGTVGRFIVVELLGHPPVEQGPITFLQGFDLSMPVFYLVAVAIFTIIPFNEEVLFRGLFQNFTTKHTSKLGGLIITPLFFALVHYQWGQGLSNIELLSPLLILSFFLSYLYQKTGSLLSCMVFHMAFNFMSVVALTLEKLGLITYSI